VNYDPANPSGQALLGVYSQMAKALLALTPLSPEEQSQVLEGALRYDAGLAKIEKTRQEWSEYTKCYNPYSVEEAAKLFGDFDLKGFLKSLYGDKSPDKVIAYDPKFLEGFQSVYNAASFEDFKSWSYLNCLVRNSAYLSEEIREIGGLYERTLMGTPKLESIEKQAYGLASALLSEPVGLYYGETYFGEEAKANITAMVKEIIKTYQRRIKENDFLSEKTKEKAILKLGTMVVKMGYPDKVDPMYDTLMVEEDDSLLEALAKLYNGKRKWSFDHLFDPTNREEWPMPGHMVNACYNPNNNDITFPAAILQKPFYDLHQLPEENLGGIGAVIGHEISHAFDNNGAKCDEYGNLNDWWTKEDFEEFQKRTQRMIEQWDGIPFAGGKVNGALVVSENIADNGGMAVTLDIMSRRENPDYQAYFYNWARVWCQKAKVEFQQLLLSIDVHSPAPLRANITPRNFAEWYRAFSVKESDQMYIPEEKRIGIW
ncbi:MAG: M13 family metallopeptidase, partial [Bacilli bacterium]|nr:M13 family metallopeptidase [Bacilli bacterium]